MEAVTGGPREGVDYGKEALAAVWWLGSSPVAPGTETAPPGPDRSERRSLQET